jgi:plastocyanin
MRCLAIMVPLLVSAVVAGCGSSSGGGGSSADASSGGGQLTLSETEFKITPASPTVASTGTITITVKNAGAITHALSVQTPSGTVSTGKIAPGASATLKVNASKAGRYTFFCPIPGHRAAGMQGVLVVGSAGAGSGIVNSTSISKTYQPSGY